MSSRHPRLSLSRRALPIARTRSARSLPISTALSSSLPRPGPQRPPRFLCIFPASSRVRKKIPEALPPKHVLMGALQPSGPNHPSPASLCSLPPCSFQPASGRATLSWRDLRKTRVRSPYFSVQDPEWLPVVPHGKGQRPYNGLRFPPHRSPRLSPRHPAVTSVSSRPLSSLRPHWLLCSSLYPSGTLLPHGLCRSGLRSLSRMLFSCESAAPLPNCNTDLKIQ